jgi:hypothetical protein
VPFLQHVIDLCRMKKHPYPCLVDQLFKFASEAAWELPSYNVVWIFLLHSNLVTLNAKMQNINLVVDNKQWLVAFGTIKMALLLKCLALRLDVGQPAVVKKSKWRLDKICRTGSRWLQNVSMASQYFFKIATSLAWGKRQACQSCQQQFVVAKYTPVVDTKAKGGGNQHNSQQLFQSTCEGKTGSFGQIHSISKD